MNYLATSFHVCIHSRHEWNVRTGKACRRYGMIQRKIYPRDTRYFTKILFVFRLLDGFHDDRSIEFCNWSKVLIVFVVSVVVERFIIFRYWLVILVVLLVVVVIVIGNHYSILNRYDGWKY